MLLTGKTWLITGGGSGIGRGLARAFYDAGNKVVVAGRRLDALQQTAEGRPAMVTLQLDVADAGAVASFAAKICAEHPELDGLINNAGIMRAENLQEGPAGLATAEQTVATNLLGPIRLTAALLPHLLQRPGATIVNVTSGLAFVPLALTPTYCATKAALHAYTESLRRQLAQRGVEVVELIPPYVLTELMDGKDDPLAMPLEAFLAETMQALRAHPQAPELRVRAVDGLRLAEREGRYAQTFAALNEAREASRAKRKGAFT